MAAKERIVFIDYLRVIACLMVMLVHSCEPFYLGGKGTLILNQTDALWVTIIDSFLRPCVPLFAIASSYLLFPVSTDTPTFYKKRAKRVLIPLIVWVLLYAVVPLWGNTYEFYKTDDLFTNLKLSLLNFPGPAGHLWFVYMILGIYLIMPVLSPWIEKVSRKGELAFLGVWFLTGFIPFLRLVQNQINGAVITADGVSWYNQGMIWGEAGWNEFGTFYYVSGFVGYLVLGHYFRKYVGNLSWSKTLAIALPLMVAGYAFSAGWFWATMPKGFPVEADVALANYMETGWCFCTPGTAMLTIAFFLIIKKFNSTGSGYRYIIRPISGASYGMYLMHIFFLCFYVDVLRAAIDSTLAVILLTAICTYLTSFVCSYLIGRIPKAGKYIVG